VERWASGTLKVEKLLAPSYDKTRLTTRAWWTAKTNLSLLMAAFGDMRRADEVIFTGSPPFILHFVAPLNILLRRKLTYRITDFFPECWMAEYSQVPFWLRLLYRLTLFWRRRVTKFEVLGEDQRTRLLESGITPARIVLKRDASPVSIPAQTQPLPRPAELAGRIILLYSGNFGVAHDCATFLEGCRRHHREGSRGVALWLNAVGRTADVLEAILRAEGLVHLRTKPVPLEQLARLLVTPDAHLITLHDRFAGFVLPSKVHGCIESGKPTLYIGPTTSDVHLLCSMRVPATAYTRVAVGDAQGVFDALERL